MNAADIWRAGEAPQQGQARRMNLFAGKTLHSQSVVMADAAYVPERRPLPCREWSISGWLAGALIRRGVSPNAISIAGMLAAIIAGLALAATAFPGFHRAGFLVALAGLGLRALGNMLDGMVAVGSGSASAVGELYNEIPDRVSDAALLAGLGFASGSSPMLGLAAAVSAVFVAYVRAQGKACGAHQEFCGPMSKPARMLVIGIVCGWSAVMPDARQSFGGITMPVWGLGVIIGGCVVTAIRRLNRIAGALKGNSKKAL